jgi:hypothetical protein
MRFTRGWKLAIALLGAMALLMQGSAYATVTWTLSNYAHSAFANSTTDNTTGSYIPTDSLTVLPSGWPVAEANDATSPFGSNSPQNGDVVASGTVTAKWFTTFCSTATLSMTGKWVEPIDSGAPANSVAEINMTTSIFSTKVYILKVNGVYEIDTPSMPSGDICSSTTAGDTNVTVDATVSGTTRHVTQNPSTAGTYTSTGTWHDTNGTTHTDTASVTIT